MLTRRGVLGALIGPALGGEERMFADAQAYEKFMGRWSRLLAPLLVDFSGLGGAEKVLDVGSGTGSLAFSIAGSRPRCRVVGIDPSKQFVAFASSRNASPERVSFEQGDAMQLRFPDAAFDAALALLVFNFIPDPDKAIGEIRRVTRPGGPVSAAVWDYGEGMRMLRVFWDAAAAVDPGTAGVDEARMRLCRAGELGRLWQHAGLKDVAERPLEIHMRFASLADYWDPFLLGQGPAGAYARKLDRERREALRGELRRRLGLTADDTPFSLPARAWAVRGIVPA